MGSSVGCLGGGSKSRQDQNGQVVAGSSPRSGTSVLGAHDWRGRPLLNSVVT
jgi:hypothetical protein